MKQTRNCKLKKYFRRYKPLFAVILVQVLIVLFFFQLWEASTPSAHILKNAVIDINDIRYMQWTKGSRIIIISANQKYYFPNLGFQTNYPNRKLIQEIEVGDELSITYYSRKGLLGPSNCIVGAYSQTEALRTIDEYNSSREGLCIWVIVSFILVESPYLIGSILYLHCCNQVKVKRKCRKRNMTQGT